MKTDNNLRKIRGAAFAALTLGVLSLLGGCAADDNSPKGKGTSTLSFNVAGINDAVDSTGTRSLPLPETVSQVQADGTVLDFTLTPVAPSSTRATTTMTAGNKYKYMLLDPSGNIVTSALDGVAGTATSQVTIDNTKSYTVVAYSYNDASSTLPSPGSGGAAPSTALGMDANKDFLYFKETFNGNIYTANSSNTRSVTFDHKYSQVTVVVNASLVGNVTSVGTVTLGPSYASTLNVATGAVAKTGTSTPATVTFGTLGTQTVTSSPAVLFTNGETPLTLSFSALTIGGTAYGAKSATFTRALAAGTAYTLTVSAHKAIPTSITLEQSQIYFVASVYDNNYLPYTVPTVAATTGASSPDGTAETLVDVQGSISTTGVTVKIPVASAPTASGTLPAYSTTVTVPSSLIQGGGSPVQLTLSWASQAYTTTTKSITATIKAVGGTLNAIKLDINAGIGNNFLGVLLAQFNYPYNNAGTLTTFQVRDTPGIPDRKFGQYDLGSSSTYEHNFLYMPVVGSDGKIWLNNNLGADYANLANAIFNLTKQATASTDWHAYGSLIQWGRPTDGHELINWTNGTTGVAKYTSTTSSRSTTDTPSSVVYITNTTYPYDWRNPANDNLWQPIGNTNNPCPYGFRVPTDSEFGTMATAAGISSIATAYSSSLKFSAAGGRNSQGYFATIGTVSMYWTSTLNGSAGGYMNGYDFSGPYAFGQGRATGYPVRCIQN